MTSLAPYLRPITDADPSTHLGARTDAALRQVRLAWASCLLVHVFLISAGHFAYWPTYTARYDLLARGFSQGHVYLPIVANPRHLALPDPYDPVANEPFRMKPGIPDSCLFAGKFYVYWGPVPALLLVPIKAIVGPDFRVGDQFLTFAFVQGILIAVAVVLLRIRQWHFPDSPAWLPAMGLLVVGLSAPLACIMTRSAVYEAAIVGGQFFLLTGLCLAWTSLRQRDASRPTDLIRLFIAGTCLALAVGCRVSLAIAVMGLGAMVAFRLIAEIRTATRQTLTRLFAFVIPLFAGAISLGWYNQIRFGQWYEFGQKYQLAGTNLRSYPSLFGLSNVLPGLWSYFLRPVTTVPHFPYLLPIGGDGTFPTFISLPAHYESYDAITGLAWVMPFLWLIPFCFVRSCETSRARGALRWLVVALCAVAVLAFAPVLLMIGSSQRYLADFTPALVIVAMIAIWKHTTSATAAPKRRRRLAIATTFAFLSIGGGLLLSIEGYAGHFRTYNIHLFQRLSGTDIGPALSDPVPAEKVHS